MVEPVDYSRLSGTIYDRERLKTFSAAIVGAGALGNEVARLLGLLGAAHVIVIDPDIVEASNLTRSVLFRLEHSQGRNKAEVLTSAARPVFPDTTWDFVPVAMADVGLLDLANADVIFSCVDSAMARIEIAAGSLKLNKPMVDGGMGSGDDLGRTAIYAGRENACFCCQLTPSTRAELLREHFQRGRSCTANVDEPIVPSAPGLASIVASLQVDRAVRYLAGEFRGGSRSWEVRLSADLQWSNLSIGRDPLCPFHDQSGLLVPAPSADITFQELLEGAGAADGTMLLDWPVCATAKCAGCGETWEPMRRLGAMRRDARCPGCGSIEWTPLRLVSAIHSGDCWWSKPLRFFSLRDNQLFTIDQ